MTRRPSRRQLQTTVGHLNDDVRILQQQLAAARAQRDAALAAADTARERLIHAERDRAEWEALCRFQAGRALHHHVRAEAAAAEAAKVGTELHRVLALAADGVEDRVRLALAAGLDEAGGRRR